MGDSDDSPAVSRRTLLRASAATAGVSAIGIGGASASQSDPVDDTLERRCPEATLRPSMGHCRGASTDGCADDHPATVDLQAAVRETLEDRYPDVGALAEAGFKPYFDTLDVGDEDGWSHWIDPTAIGDDTVLDPDRPESVLVDNDSWRSIGVMFVATRDGEAVEPPVVYEADDGRCSPWHYHAGLPGRFAWWYYRQVYDRQFEEGDVQFPCRTPCMMHVWTVDHPEGVHAHDGPPPASRDRPPADDPALETDAEPGEDRLSWDALPDDLEPDRRPEELSWHGPF